MLRNDQAMAIGHVKFENRNLKISEKFARLTKNAITPSIFEISLNFFLLMVTDGPLLKCLESLWWCGWCGFQVATMSNPTKLLLSYIELS